MLECSYASPFGNCMTQQRVLAAFEKCGTSPVTMAAAEHKAVTLDMSSDATSKVDEVFDLHKRNLAALEAEGLETITLQVTPRVGDAIGPIVRPGRWDEKVKALAYNKQSAGTLMIVGGGVGWDSEMCLQAAALKADKALAATAADKEKKKKARAALKEEVDDIRALKVADADLSGDQLRTLLRWDMPKGGASKFTTKGTMLAQYVKVKGDGSNDEEGAAAPAAQAPPPAAAAAPSPGADWKRVDVSKLGDIDLDAHMLMLRQEKARRARGCERRRVYRVWVEKACKFNDLIVHKFRREKN